MDLKSMVTDISSCSDSKNAVGGVGMYCYGENGGLATIQVPQPMYNPAPYVAPASQSTHCYCNPCLIAPWVNPVPAFTPFVSYYDTSYCGVPWKYSPCEGTGDSLIIPYPTGTVPHETVSYMRNCYSVQGMSKDTTGLAVVKLADVTPAYDCQDVLCFPAVDPEDPHAPGFTARYQDYETGKDVDVYIDHADKGLPYFAVIHETYDSGQNGLSYGTLSFVISRGGQDRYLFSSTGTGPVKFTFFPSSVERRIVRCRNGSADSVSLGMGVSTITLDLIPGDRLTAGLATAKSVAATVTWNPVVASPRLYATGSISPAVPTQVKSIGFTGLTDRSRYTFYESLPSDVTMGEVNPDCILTVTAQGVEYVLIRARGITDEPPSLPLNSVGYSNQSLTGPLVFKLYAGREDAGQNGDMDVWLGTPGVLPDSFAVSPYKALIKTGTVELTNRTPEVYRNSLLVLTLDQVPSHVAPIDYVAGDGSRTVLAAVNSSEQPSTRTVSGKVCAKAKSNPGLAYKITSV